jgi:phage tail-like protein
MRGTVPGLDTPYPIAGLLPVALQEDGLATRLTAGLDDVLAPVIATLDCLSAYVDPRLAPADFLTWLGTWVGVALDESWPLDRRRATVAQAVALYRTRGTPGGLRAHLEVLTGGQVEVTDSGGVYWSTTPDSTTATEGPPALAVRVTDPDRGASDPVVLHELVGSSKPAHVPHTVEIVTEKHNNVSNG